MRSMYATFVGITVFLFGPFHRADWVDLTSGVSLRGVDYRETE